MKSFKQFLTEARPFNDTLLRVDMTGHVSQGYVSVDAIFMHPCADSDICQQTYMLADLIRRGNPTNMPFELEYADIGDLIPTQYQIYEAHAATLMKSFIRNAADFQPIDVLDISLTERQVFAIIDGHHRAAAMIVAGTTQVPCRSWLVPPINLHRAIH